MSKLRCHISISLDGFVAGPNQSQENPLGEGGERLHDWVVPLAPWRQSHGKQGRLLAAKTSCLGAAPTLLSSPWQRHCSTNLRSTSPGCCWGGVPASSTTSGTRRLSSSRSGRSRRLASPTSSTGW